ncbi:MAG: radical SAM protein [Patescibacteria group bacterium]
MNSNGEIYLRVVLLNNCNIKCFFCHKEGSGTISEKIQPINIIKAVSVASMLGIKTVKFTGGEPLLYKELSTVISKIKELHPDVEISLTTNGIFLKEYISDLLDAGLDRVNVSLQTLDPLKYYQITGVDCLEKVIRGIETLIANKKTDSKICSAFFKKNSTEILSIAKWAKTMGLGYRVHNLLPALEETRSEIIPIEKIEQIITSFPGASRLEINKNNKHRILFSGKDWDIEMPDWRFWKKCRMSKCPINNQSKGVCNEGEVYAIRLTSKSIQTCLLGNKKNFIYNNLDEIHSSVIQGYEYLRYEIKIG